MEPWLYQIPVLEKLEEHFKTNKVGLMVMATGLGKTAVSAFFVRQTLRKKKKARVAYICHQQEILQQAQSTYEKILEDCPEEVFGFLHRSRKDYDAQILFTTFQSLSIAIEKGELSPDDFDVVIVDESHHGTAETFMSVIESLEYEQMLAMTATPDRPDQYKDDGYSNIRRIFGNPVVDVPIDVALQNGWLSKFEYKIMHDDLNVGTIQSILKEENPEAFRNVSKRSLNTSLFIEKHDSQIAEEITEHTKDKKTIIFASSIAHAERMAVLLPNCRFYHSELSELEKAQIMRQFKTGRLQYIVVVNMFNEGIDVPDADAAVFLRCTSSPIIFLQQLGRILRFVPGKVALVLDFVANIDRISLINEVFDNVVTGKSEKTFVGGHNYSFSFDMELIAVARVMDKIRSFTLEFEGRVAMLARYVKANGKNPDSKYIDPKTQFKLGNQVVRWRKSYFKKGRAVPLHEDEIEALESAGIVWNPRGETSFVDRVRMLLKYFLKHGTCPKNNYIDEKTGCKLGMHLNAYRQAYNGTGQKRPLTELEVAMLDAAGMQWKVKGRINMEDCDPKRLEKLITQYGEEQDSAKEKAKQVVKKKKKLAQLREVDRRKEQNLSKKLEKNTFEGQLVMFQRFVYRYGCNPPTRYRDPKTGFNIGRKVNRWIEFYLEGKARCTELNSEQIKLLEQSGIQWEKRQIKQYLETFDAIDRYIAKYKKEPTLEYLDPKTGIEVGRNLARWKGTLRSRAGITERQKEALRSIGVAI